MATLLDVAAAREAVLGSVRPLEGEEVALEEALGRVLAGEGVAEAGSLVDLELLPSW